MYLSLLLLSIGTFLLFIDAICARAVSVALYLVLAPGTAGKMGRGWRVVLQEEEEEEEEEGKELDLGLVVVVLKKFEDTSSSDFNT